MNITYLGIFVCAVLTSFLLTRNVRNLANSRGWVYVPLSARHIHTDLIPHLGGIAIFIAVALVAVTLIALPSLPGIETALSRRTVFYILGPATLVFLLGLYDDFRPVRPYVKFSVQAVAATLMFFGGFGVFQVQLPFGSFTSGWLALPLTIVWVLWITNAFNLLDGIDGLSAGSALFSTLTVFVVSLIGGNFLISALTLALAGSILGFLRFNFNPATIFLGDCGSLFIGFMLSALALAGAGKSPTIVAVAIPVVCFGLPVLETVLSVFRRFLSGQPLFGADRGHIHHKLLERGFSQRKVVLILYSVSAACGLMSLFLMYPSGALVGIVPLVIVASVWMGVQHLGYHEFIELGRAALRTVEHKKIILNNLTIRRATQALSTTKDMEGMGQILRDSFDTNDFDAFELVLDPALADILDQRDGPSQLKWRRSNGSWDRATSEWALTLELNRSSGEKLGTFTIHRKCNGPRLFVDINLLISGFNDALAAALDRAVRNAAAEPAGAKEPIDEKIPPSGLPQANRGLISKPTW